MTTRQEIEQALASESQRATLLHTFQKLAERPDFSDFADMWGPALYRRSPTFFASFLRTHLAGHAEVLPTLLPQIEADGHDDLFTDLYHSLSSEVQWNQDLLALARSNQPDGEVQRAVARRALHRRWYRLSEEAALALYRRSPDLFRPFLVQHIRRWWHRQDSYRTLQQETHRRGDRALYWHLFRHYAAPHEWKASLELLLRQPIPADQIEAELRLRHPSYVWDYEMSFLLRFLEKYGVALLPYIEENIYAITHRDPQPLLKVLAKLGDESAYWRCFFLVANPQLWNENLRTLLRQPMDDETLHIELQRRTPPGGRGRWSWWHLSQDLALYLYQRNPERFRPFVERFIHQSSPALFQAAQARADDLFLDYLTFLGMRTLASLVYQAYPPAYWRNAHPHQAEARRQLEEEGSRLTARFDALYADSPDRYLRHAANTLSFFRPFEVWSVTKNLEYNPPFAYLFTRHREAWQQSPPAIRELLESPNIYIQIAGLDMLAEGGEAAAQRVIENLSILRALLLSRARRSTKRRVLRALEQAAYQGPPYAAAILPVLEETMDFRSKRAIGERIMVSYVRLRRHLADEGRKTPSGDEGSHHSGSAVRATKGGDHARNTR